MAGWNGAGEFSRAYDWTNERDADYNIDATKFDVENDAFAAGINNCIAKDGQNAATADLPMGGNKHTGVAKGTASTHYARVSQVQVGEFSGGTTGGSANVQTLALVPAATTITQTMLIQFVAGFTNTAAMTLNVNAIGAYAVKLNGAALVGGEIVAGRAYVVSASTSVNQFDIIGPTLSGSMS